MKKTKTLTEEKKELITNYVFTIPENERWARLRGSKYLMNYIEHISTGFGNPSSAFTNIEMFIRATLDAGYFFYKDVKSEEEAANLLDDLFYEFDGLYPKLLNQCREIYKQNNCECPY